ncbi:DUF3263 domain-containing protein [Corynebacterium caspium]|uniref:DUF3263 domain-containing protein n=1 Tax=Corynebacterium caspium TaxID=234828 RepID=UPI00037A7C7D|nr:DUF3263 domain-containing protein [Corynebacterium caspium]WKD58672.1 hypothetical protein CCASP_01230 [Corynebacterium caspium DSM 44850]
MSLSAFDIQLLNFAENAPRARGVLDDAIREELGITPVRYWQRLNILLDDASAHRAYPYLINRLRRLRDQPGPWDGKRYSEPGTPPENLS